MMVKSEQPKTTVWRSDLEGLRVVAILLVAMYHVFTTRVSGGVDVFLMISGFFVGGSLWRRFVAGNPPGARSYLVRHARRLLPTAITVLAATAIAFVVVAPRTRWEGGAKETLASLFYFENWYLATTGQEYGAADVNQSPWQHFWSMSVQGQFFLATPLLFAAVWVLVKKRSRIVRERIYIWLVVSVLVLSFAYATFSVVMDQSVAYFDTGARIWEFFVGILLAITVERTTRKSSWWHVASWLGVATLLFTGVVIDGASVFPGPATLVPVLGAALLVLSGDVPGRFSASRLLSLKWVSYCGRYAYAFYLWHWPMLVLVTTLRGRPSGWKVGILVLAVSAVLSVLTHHLVERPLRENNGRSERRQLAPRLRWRGVVGIGVVVTGFCIIGASVAYTIQSEQRRAQFASGVDLDPMEYPGAMAIIDPESYGEYVETDPMPAPELAAKDTSKVLADGCVTSNQSSEFINCSYVDGGGLRVALFGGSHSEQWFEVALALAEKHDWTLVPVLRAACPPTSPDQGNGPECTEWLIESYEELEQGDFDLIITTGTRPTNSGASDYIPGGYQRMMQTLSAHSSVLAIRDNPSFQFDMPECYAQGKACEVPLYSRLAKEDPTLSIDIDGVEFVQMNDLICPEEVCRPVYGNQMVFRDTSHLTTTYVKSMLPEVMERWEDGIAALGLEY